MILAAILTFSIFHALLVIRCLLSIKAPALAYVLSVPLWFFAWPIMSLSCLWIGLEDD